MSYWTDLYTPRPTLRIRSDRVLIIYLQWASAPPPVYYTERRGDSGDPSADNPP